MAWRVSVDRVVLALWVGSMWTVGFLVAPVLFTMLPSKDMAGDVAARLFDAVGWIGLGSAAWLLASYAIAPAGERHIRRGMTLAVMAVITAIGEWLILPHMAALKAAAGGVLPTSGPLLGRFAAWHHLSTTLFVVNALLGLGLVAVGPMSEA